MKKFTIVLFFVILSFMLSWLSCSEEKPKEIVSESKELFQEPSESHPGKLITHQRACYFDDIDTLSKSLDIQLELADAREKLIVEEIMTYAGLPANFLLFRGEVSNALAIEHSQKRLIIYNKDMFNVIDRQSNNFWSSVFIVAHEIGHHLTNNITEGYSPIQAELEADAFAANILYKMGADTSQTLSAIQSRFISNERDTKTHPAKSKRLSNVLQNWMNASILHQRGAIPPPPEDGIKNNSDFTGFGKMELWDQHYNQLYKEGLSIIETVGFEGVVISTKPLTGYDDGTSDVRNFETVIHLTHVPEINEAAMPHHVNQREKFKVNYSPMATDGEDPDIIYQFFRPGRRIIFSVIYYIDQIGGEEVIVDVRKK